jgi:hypothetical protein
MTPTEKLNKARSIESRLKYAIKDLNSLLSDDTVSVECRRHLHNLREELTITHNTSLPLVNCLSRESEMV